MLSNPPPYQVEDRSVLLPYYKRFLVGPFLPALPTRLSPNLITHAGHVLCIASMFVLYRSPRGWPLALSALLLHAYLWCDNADGAHARRTGQASTAGEYLDHGLDLLNCVYIGVVSMCALALVGDVKGLAIAAVIPCASAVTCWEQSVTGVYRLGFLNQIESITFLTLVMAVDVAFGLDTVMQLRIVGFTVQWWIWFFVDALAVFGIARTLVRVAVAKKSVFPALGFLALLGVVLHAYASGALGGALAHTFAGVVIVAFGVHMLRTRIVGERPTSLVGSLGFGAALLLAATARFGLADRAALLLSVASAALAGADMLVIVRRANPATSNQSAE